MIAEDLDYFEEERVPVTYKEVLAAREKIEKIIARLVASKDILMFG